jgi:hypothetical protein
MALTEFKAGVYISADSPKGFVNLYSKLTAQDHLDTTSYVGSVQNRQPNGVNFGTVVGWRTAKKLVKIKLKIPITRYLGLSEITEVWADAAQISVYAPSLNEGAAQFYYCTGEGVRLRSSPSLTSLSNVAGKAHRGDLLGKSDGYTDNDFMLMYATSLSGSFLLDGSGKKKTYYVHKNYVSTTNPIPAKPADPTAPADTNQPSEGNGKPEVTDEPTTAVNTAGILVAIGLGVLALGVALVNYVKKRTAKPAKR